MTLAIAVLLLATASAEPERVPLTRVRPLEVTPIVGRVQTLYGPTAPTGPSILHIWASWCPPCRSELPQLLVVSKKYLSVRVVAVAWADEKDQVDRFLAGVAIAVPETRNHTVYLASKQEDPTSPDSKYWEVHAFPTTYFIAADGTIVKRVVGTIDWSSETTRLALENFQNGKPFEIAPGE